MEIVGYLQCYEWGKHGKDSLVAQIQASNVGLKIDDSTPYAELWMGVHRSGEAKIKDSMQPLSDYIRQSSSRFSGGLNIEQSLPFLFKVLSVNKALSIQCHPNKSQATDLFRRMPDVYKDGNHKPEMTIALTEFEVMSGFRPVNEIQTFLKEVPEFEMIIPKQLLKSYINEPKDVYLKQILQHWLARAESDMAPAINHFLERFKNQAKEKQDRYLYPIIKRLFNWYPNDVGVFMPFFLNFFTLQPGECMFIAAGVPHAYVQGDCVECMACSDNVVRCGLTPKFKDTNVLMEIIDLNSYSVSDLKMQGSKILPCDVMVYDPPNQEFGITIVTIDSGEVFVTEGYDCCSIFIVLSGEGDIKSKGNERKTLKFSSIFFLLPNEKAEVKCSTGPMKLYFAYGVNKIL